MKEKKPFSILFGRKPGSYISRASDTEEVLDFLRLSDNGGGSLRSDWGKRFWKNSF